MFNEEENIRKHAFPENEGKFCIRECSREIIPIENDFAKLYCSGCERIIRILKKKKKGE